MFIKVTHVKSNSVRGLWWEVMAPCPLLSPVLRGSHLLFCSVSACKFCLSYFLISKQYKHITFSGWEHFKQQLTAATGPASLTPAVQSVEYDPSRVLCSVSCGQRWLCRMQLGCGGGHFCRPVPHFQATSQPLSAALLRVTVNCEAWKYLNGFWNPWSVFTVCRLVLKGSVDLACSVLELSTFVRHFVLSEAFNGFLFVFYALAHLKIPLM